MVSNSLDRTLMKSFTAVGLAAALSLGAASASTGPPAGGRPRRRRSAPSGSMSSRRILDPFPT